MSSRLRLGYCRTSCSIYSQLVYSKINIYGARSLWLGVVDDMQNRPKVMSAQCWQRQRVRYPSSSAVGMWVELCLGYAHHVLQLNMPPLLLTSAPTHKGNIFAMITTRLSTSIQRVASTSFVCPMYCTATHPCCVHEI